MGDIFVAEIPIFFLSTVVAGPQPTYEEKIRVPPPPPHPRAESAGFFKQSPTILLNTKMFLTIQF